LANCAVEEAYAFLNPPHPSQSQTVAKLRELADEEFDKDMVAISGSIPYSGAEPLDPNVKASM